MSIENEMLSRFNKHNEVSEGIDLSSELDFFFDNVMDTVVEFFTEQEKTPA